MGGLLELLTLGLVWFGGLLERLQGRCGRSEEVEKRGGKARVGGRRARGAKGGKSGK